MADLLEGGNDSKPDGKVLKRFECERRDDKKHKRQDPYRRCAYHGDNPCQGWCDHVNERIDAKHDSAVSSQVVAARVSEVGDIVGDPVVVQSDAVYDGHRIKLVGVEDSHLAKHK